MARATSPRGSSASIACSTSAGSPGATRAAADAALARNDIARVEIETQQPLAIDAYDAVRAGGAFVLVDTASHRTVAAGMVRTEHDAADD